MASAAPTKLSSRHWRMLIDAIHDGRCIPFLGAGVNAGTDDYQGLPLGNEVTLPLIEKIVGRRVSNLQDLIEIKVDPILSKYEGLVPDNPLQLSWVADYFRQATDSSRLLEVIQDILAYRDREPSPLLETLAGIPFNLVVTFNYDKLMEKALEKAGVPYQVSFSLPRGSIMRAPIRSVRPFSSGIDASSINFMAISWTMETSSLETSLNTGSS